jgi:hypothetical protein
VFPHEPRLVISASLLNTYLRTYLCLVFCTASNGNTNEAQMPGLRMSRTRSTPYPANTSATAGTRLARGSPRSDSLNKAYNQAFHEPTNREHCACCYIFSLRCTSFLDLYIMRHTALTRASTSAGPSEANDIAVSVSVCSQCGGWYSSNHRIAFFWIEFTRVLHVISLTATLMMLI